MWVGSYCHGLFMTVHMGSVGADALTLAQGLNKPVH